MESDREIHLFVQDLPTTLVKKASLPKSSYTLSHCRIQTFGERPACSSEYLSQEKTTFTLVHCHSSLSCKVEHIMRHRNRRNFSDVVEKMKKRLNFVLRRLFCFLQQRYCSFLFCFSLAEIRILFHLEFCSCDEFYISDFVTVFV